jgi:DNA (cytosine-5)-methyltransferase 1
MVLTARAAGHACVLGDVAVVDPRELIPIGERCEGVIFSPPCPSFSAAGKQLGRRDLPAIHRLIDYMAVGMDLRPYAYIHMHDPRSILTVEPMRWVTLLTPEWIALEQVPAVLPLWEHMAECLRAQYGYSVWTGMVYAERYGVPQTRQRAVLLASRAREVSEPIATHRRYFPPGHRYAESGNGDGHLPRWVSMAEALGWNSDWVVEYRRGGDRINEATPVSSPSPTITSRTNRWQVKTHPDMPESTRKLRSDSWPLDRPATTITGDPRVFPPGGHHVFGSQSRGAIRVSIQEAAVLQTFPSDYPFQGTRTKQFLQVGNAIPCRLAQRLLESVLP